MIEKNEWKKVGDNGDLFTIEEWRKAVDSGLFNSYDGSGSWVQFVGTEGKYMTDCLFDNVFGPVPEGATHVEWYNK